MKNFFILGLSLLALSCASTGPKKAEDLTVKDFFKNSIVRTFRVSPDGKWVAALKPYKDRMNIYYTEFGKHNWKRLTSYSDRGVNLIGWKNSDTLLFMKDSGGDENFHVFAVNKNTKEVKDLSPAEGARSYIIDTLRYTDKNHILVSSNKRLKQVSDVYKINVNSGEQEMVLKNPGNQTSWVTDHRGAIRMAVSTDGVNVTYYYRDKAGDKFKKIKTLNFKDSVSPVAFDFDNKNVFLITNVGRDKSIVTLANPKNFKTIKVLYKNPNYDVTGLSLSEKRKEIIAATYQDWKTRKNVFSNYYQKILKDLESKLSDKEIYLTSHNDEENLFTVYAGSDKSRGMYYSYDAKTRDLKFLANPSPWIDESQMADMKPIKYKSRDGLIIEGYLTLPKGKEGAKNLPLVVNPHGGPWARDLWGYNPEVQYLANKGYAVLQMNFRGSTGYGKKFWKASFKEWGKSMQDDVTDGVKWLVNQNTVDPDRICIYGGSYGGYATLAGLAFTPDLYKCGVDYVGVSNLFTFQETIPVYWKPYKAMIEEMVGHPEKDKKLLKSASPYYHADKIKAALFVAQGANDPRVKKSESDQIVNALKERGVEVEYMVKNDEGHGFHNEENRFEFYKKMEFFINENIGEKARE